MRKRRSLLFYPLSLVYGLITSFRNFLYNSRLLHSEEFSLPVICIGNITVGGTGKTPHTGYLVELLKDRFRVAVLSRGYRRKTKGFLASSQTSSVKEIGDEPLQLFSRYPEIIVAADAYRVNGVKRILKEHPGTDLIILDDGFQHRKIKPGLSILLTDFNNPMENDFMLPYGNLRESPGNIRRADVIIVTKSPEMLPPENEKEIIDKYSNIFPGKIFFTAVSYLDPIPVFKESPAANLSLEKLNKDESSALLLTGIASPGPLLGYLEAFFREIVHLKFPDHHYFNEKDIKKMHDTWNGLRSNFRFVITTEKDAVRLREFSNIEGSIKQYIYYVPVCVKFLNDTGSEFDNLIIEYAGKNKGDSRIPEVGRN